MTRSPSRRLTSAMVLRIIADAVMINAALLFSLVWRYLWSIGVEGRLDVTLAAHLHAYASTFWMLTPVCIIVFYFSGMYTRGRAYRGRYKALVVIQAVSLSYLIFGFVLFLAHDLASFPRSTLLMAWLLTLIPVLGARLWMAVLAALVQPGHQTSGDALSQSGKEKVLVIGGAGYIGCALVERLLELGYGVRVLDRLIYGDQSIAQFYQHPSFELVEGDFRYIDTVVKAAKGADAIVHLGAIVGDPACSLCEDLTLEINLGATQTIAEIGKGFGVKRFIFASTCSVYGASDELLDERSALCPISLYARTKVESEKVLLRLADASFAPTILRFATIYGLSGRPRFDLVVNLLTAKALQEGQAGIFGGTQWRPLVHVKDVADAIVLTLQAPLSTVSRQIFNVGCNEQNYQIAELGPMIKDMVPSARVIVQPTEDNRNYRVSFDKIHKMLNFQPRYTVRDGIAEIIDAFTTGKITDYRNPYYNNFSFLKEDHRLPEILLTAPGGWDWVRLSPTEAAMLAEVMMAVIESQSEELLSNLREGLVEAILGNVDGFLDILTGMRLSLLSEEAAVPQRRYQPSVAESHPERRTSTVQPMPA